MVIVKVSHEGYVLRGKYKKQNFKEILENLILKEKSNAVTDRKKIHVFFNKIDNSPELRIMIDILFTGPESTERSVGCIEKAVMDHLSKEHNIVLVVSFKQKARAIDWRSKKK